MLSFPDQVFFLTKMEQSLGLARQASHHQNSENGKRKPRFALNTHQRKEANCNAYVAKWPHLWCNSSFSPPPVPHKALPTLNRGPTRYQPTRYQLIGYVWGIYLPFQRQQEIEDTLVAFKG